MGELMRAIALIILFGLLSIGAAHAFLYGTYPQGSSSAPTTCTVITIGTTVTIGTDVVC